MFFEEDELRKLKTDNQRLEAELLASRERLEYIKSILFNGIEGYINAVYIEPEPPDYERICFQTVPLLWKITDEIEGLLKEIEQSFSDKLMEIIRERGLNEVEVYKKADIDRRHFSKIRSDSEYRPKKDTVILLCLSMELTYEETQDLLKRAGLALSRSSKQDIIAEYFLKRKIYDIPLYKEVLYKHGFIKED